MVNESKRSAKAIVMLVGMIFVLFMIASAYLLLSPVSYFYVKFKEPLSREEALDFLKDNKIDPRNHMVAVNHSTLQNYNSIYAIDIGKVNDDRVVSDMVFNTKLYALKALNDSRVRTWSIKGPRNPYD
ncbi:MAG: hypothetical protein QME41_10015 [Actinomycetota bacterium]|nr:hypothetical protein [Actinomycetota bacterium]